MTDTPDRDKILARIQKCLNLAKSSEPHEAAAAMRQAQKLMAAHAISDDEIMSSDVHNIVVISRAPHYKKLPLNFAYMTGIVTKAFGVEVCIEPQYVNYKPRLAFRYFGPKAQVEMAAYAHKVIDRAVWAAWNEHKAENPWVSDQRGARMGFWVGWLQEVRSKVINFYATKKEAQEEARAAGNTSLVPIDEAAAQKAKQALAMNKHYGGDLRDSITNKMSLNGATHAAGREAAKDFQLHRPMEGSQQKQLSSN